MRKDAVTSGFVSDLFTFYLDDKGQAILLIYLQFTLSKTAKQCILTICKKNYMLGVSFIKCFIMRLTVTTSALMFVSSEITKDK